MRKEILAKKHKRLLEKRDALKNKALASNDVNEVRSINEQIEDVNADIEETAAEIAAIEEEERAAEQKGEERELPPKDAEMRGAKIVGSFGEEKREVNLLESAEYRSAFKAYVQAGTPIPAEYRAGDAISTEDTGAAIPLTIMNEVINTVRKRYGNLYSRVLHLTVKGGVEYPVGALQAKFKWINESTVSPRQKLAPVAKIQFSYHTAEIRIAQTFVSQIVTLDAFENKIAEVIAIAYLQAMDNAIVNGTGDGMPLGILNDPRVASMGQSVSFTAAQINNWTEWRKKLFAKMPLGYRDGEFIFNLATVDAYLETMADSNNNPVFRQATGLEVDSGDERNPRGRFFGREIALVEPDILPDFDTASSGDVIGVYWQPKEYAINENFGFTMRRYFDEETNEWVDKALVVTDGKALNPTGFILIKKA